MQELSVLRNIYSPTLKVVVHLCSGNEEVPVDVQMHGMYTIQGGIVVYDVAP